MGKTCERREGIALRHGATDVTKQALNLGNPAGKTKEKIVRQRPKKDMRWHGKCQRLVCQSS